MKEDVYSTGNYIAIFVFFLRFLKKLDWLKNNNLFLQEHCQNEFA